MNQRRRNGLRLISKAVEGCIKLIQNMSISTEREDDDLRELKHTFDRAKSATNNSLHKYENKKGE